MEKVYIIICAYVYVSVWADGQSEESKPNSKILTRFQNFESCIENFEIQEDKIIRTEDSRNMGAKYISETDVKSREECLRLCCVTDACDVFVFEDKVPGSCYLFHCGSSDDFKCKFTKHRNYTSGILTANHQASDAQESDTFSKHEQELNQLRISEEGTLPVELNRSFGETTHQQVNNLQKTPGYSFEDNKTVDQRPSERNVCSRFQFKCRVSGECIAVYNACDGIPQCVDGSDESPNLNCSVTVTSPQIPIAMSSRNQTDQDSLTAYNNMYQRSQQMIPVSTMLKNIEQDNAPVDTSAVVENRIPYPQRLNKVKVQEQIDDNVLKKTEKNNMESAGYEATHQQQPYHKKPDEILLNNSASTYTGFQKYLTVPREQDSDKLQEQTYVPTKNINDQTQHSKQNFAPKFPDAKFQTHMNYNFFPDRSNINNPQLHNGQMPLFLNPDHLTKIHPANEMQMKQNEAETNSALQLTNMRLSETLPHEYRNHQSEIKEELHREGLNPPVLQDPRMEVHDLSENKNKNEKELNIENGISRPLLRNRGEEARIPSYPDTSMQEIPERLYKYEDGEKHIFTHKGHGLVADTDSPELPRKIVPSVHYKSNNQDSVHNNVQNHGLQNSRPQTEYSTSQVKLYKMLKNTPQPVDGDNGYQLPSDYLYDDVQRPLPLDTHVASNNGQIPISTSTALHKDHQNHGYSKTGSLFRNMKTPENASSVQDAKQSQEVKEQIRKSKTHEELAGHPESVKQSYLKSHREQFVDLQQSDVYEPQDDRQQDRPSGALLSVSFGLCITSIMAILVACRLKVVKRRFRRNGKSLYAHDADFLVNGMYL